MSLKNAFTRILLAALGFLGAGDALAARTTTFFHNDGLGSVVAATNEAGTVLWRKDYAPFGEQIDETPDNERLSYTGKQHDEVTGLTNFGARQYDPEIARFLNVDPVAFVESNTMSFNRYLYVNNNPYKYVDPDGEFLNFAVKFVLDVGLNIAINYATTGSLGIGMALKDSVIGIANPAKTIAKIGKLAKLVAKANKTCKLSCFVAGTMVLTENGYEPIETLEVGNLVWAHDPDTGETALKPIVKTFVNTKDSVWELLIDRDGFEYRHEVTGSHPYYVLDGEGGGHWVHVAELVAGSFVETEGGGRARIVALEDTGEVATTYNFEVADINTYYVGAAKVLVHNCGGEQGRDALGKFMKKNAGDAAPGSGAEKAAWDAIRQKKGWTVTEGRISVRDKSGQLRVYDGYATSPRGRNIGLEIKSGDASRNKAQRTFDQGIGSNNPAQGVGKSEGVTITKAKVIRRP
jgi:RHS repeat-associated protein